MDENLSIDLSMDEALVFFEWLATRNEQAPHTDETAEHRVLWDIEAQLETKLPMLFAPNYSALLDDARRRLLTPDE